MGKQRQKCAKKYYSAVLLDPKNLERCFAEKLQYLAVGVAFVILGVAWQQIVTL